MKIILPIIFIFLYIGCSSKKENNSNFTLEQIEQLDLNNVKLLNVSDKNKLVLNFNSFLSEKGISINELIDSIKYIPLQTTEESLIAEVNKLICTDHYYFILDSDIGKNVFIFSNEGTFIKRIPTGEGPEEIYNPGDIAINEEEKHLIIYNRKGLSSYDFQGNFIKRELLPFNFKNFRTIPNGFLFVIVPNQNNHLKDLSKMQILITDRNFRIISAGLPFHYSENINYGITDYTSSFMNDINFSFKFSNIIYQYVDTLCIQTKYLLDFSDKELPAQYIETSTKEILDVLKNNNFYYFMGDFIENNTHEYFALNNRYNKKAGKTFIFRDKANRRLIGGNKILLNDNIPFFGYPLTAYKNEFIGAISSQVINSYLSENQGKWKNSKLFDQIDSDSNPILIKYTLQ